MIRVVIAKASGGDSGRHLSKDEYRGLLESGFKALAGLNDIKSSVSKFLPGGTIGLKVSCLARKFNSTPVPLADALVELLIQTGISENKIIIWERTNQELESAGYALNTSAIGRKCLGTDTDGYGYSRDFYSSGPVNSLVSRILTETVDHNINLPVLKDHSIAGLSSGMKNMYGVINNPNKYHDTNCDPFVAHVSNLEPLKAKNRLSIIDAVRVQYNGGPGFDSRYLARYNGLILSDNPVAADRVALEILEHCRQQNALPSLEKAGRPAKFLKTAESIGLGTADLSKIDLKVIVKDAGGGERPGEMF
jgi:uncharacterized protein (DUF362 family)